MALADAVVEAMALETKLMLALPGVISYNTSIWKTKKRLLMIPHAPGTAIRTRTSELASALSSLGVTTDLYRLNSQPPGMSKIEKLRWHLQEIVPRFRYDIINDNLREVRGPVLHYRTAVAKIFTESSSLALLKHDYDYVITAAYDHLPTRKRFFRGKLIYDLVDDHASGWRLDGKNDLADRIDRFVLNQMQQADQIVTSSLVLHNLAQCRYQRDSLVIPNGARVKHIRESIFANGFRRTLQEPIQIGYVGGLDNFVRIDHVVEAIKILRQRGSDFQLTVVGEGPAIKKLKPYPWLKFQGFRPPDEIPAFMQSFHVGIVPFTLAPFTDAALPLKVLEYGAGKIITVSTPLEELRLRKFPWVILAQLDIDAWVEALDKASKTQWDDSWNTIVDDFEWSASASQLIEGIA